MKTVTVNFLGFDEALDPAKQWILRILRKRYDVKLLGENEQAEYSICSLFDTGYNYLYGNKQSYIKANGVRILFSGENFIPDYNVIDYSICSYPIKFYDRNYSMPGYSLILYKHLLGCETKERKYDKSILEGKKYFANFLASHASEYQIRENFCMRLQEKYKRVECPGNICHNSPIWVNWQDEGKTDFQKECKFTLCFESTYHEGFVTEKIVDAFYSDTIPVYYGSKYAKEIFNPKAFIDISDYASYDEAIEAIKELDSDDEKYLKMLNEPIFNDPHYATKLSEGLEEFLYNIFDKPYEKAMMRSNFLSGIHHQKYIKWSNDVMKPILVTRWYLMLSKDAVKRFFKKLLKK